MPKHAWPAAAVLLLLFSGARAEEPKKPEPKFAIVRITNLRGEKSIHMLEQYKVQAKRDALQADYQKERQAWEDRRRNWDKMHRNKPKPFTETEPVPGAVDILKEDIPGEMEARKVILEVRKAEAQKEKERREKEKREEKEKPK